MGDRPRTFLDKARESVVGASIELEGGRCNNSANRSYYACFQAAIHALIMEGIRPPGGGAEWGHGYVEAQFVGQLIHRRHRYDAALRPVIGQNRELREAADYALEAVAPIRAARALQRAERLVRAVEQRRDAEA